MPDPTPAFDKIRELIKRDYNIDVGPPPSIWGIIKEVILDSLGFRSMDIIFEGKVVAKTRFPWWHQNFGGWKGWRRQFEKAIRRKVGSLTWYILGRFMGRLVLIDADPKQCWIVPRYDAPRVLKTTDEKLGMYRVGWLYWALVWTAVRWYPNPTRYMPGFKDLPEARV